MRHRVDNPRLATEAEVLRGVIAACGLMGVEIERQNTGGLYNKRGQYVAFGTPGNADLTGMTTASWGELAGRRVEIECKREGFNPKRTRGATRERWLKQIGKLRTVNANGGFGFWADDPEYAFQVLRWLKTGGFRIDVNDDFEVWLTRAED